jgi:RNA polymerase sigma-70 factor (ECF subfamily)
MVGPGTDAEDLTQDVFVRAFINIRSFQSRASLNTWLFRIATNICIDFTRRTRKTRALFAPYYREDDEEETDVERDLPDNRLNPEALLMNSELGAKINEALGLLPDKLRTVVLLHDIEGLPYEEIARIVDCPLGTVKSRLFNARMALRVKLTPYLNSSAGL